MENYGVIFANVYDRLFGGYADKASSLLLRFFGSQDIVQSCPKVLDLGCGTGQAAFRFLEAGYLVTGLDLSQEMLEIAQKRCRRSEVSGRADWAQKDLSGFKLPGPYGLAFSTYNSLNHLGSEEHLRGCFRSVRDCLAPGGYFVFDYHTQKGLQEWTDREEGSFPAGKVRITRSFEPKAGRASMLITGIWDGQPFETQVINYDFPIEKVRQWLVEEGFSKVIVSDWENLPEPIQDPEKESRVVFLCS
jgi:SAM-dependent methyltransferase